MRYVNMLLKNERIKTSNFKDASFDKNQKNILNFEWTVFVWIFFAKVI